MISSVAHVLNFLKITITFTSLLGRCRRTGLLYNVSILFSSSLLCEDPCLSPWTISIQVWIFPSARFSSMWKHVCQNVFAKLSEL